MSRSTAIKAAALLGGAALLAGCNFNFHAGFLISPETQAANRFLDLTTHLGPAAGYATTTAAFRNGMTQGVFDEVARRMHLTDVEHASWMTANADARKTMITGDIKLSDGQTIPLKAYMVREGGQWRVGLITEAQPMTMRIGDRNVAYPGSHALESVGDTTLGPASPDPNDVENAGLPGASLRASRVGPFCLNMLAKQGIHLDDATCTNDLPLQAGGRQICVARKGDKTGKLTVNFVNYNAQTRNFRLFCWVQASVLQ